MTVTRSRACARERAAPDRRLHRQHRVHARGGRRERRARPRRARAYRPRRAARPPRPGGPRRTPGQRGTRRKRCCSSPPSRAPRPRSHLGGACLVAPGAPWPLSADGRPLSFLAALDLAELDARRAQPLLPAAGTLLFYADLEGDVYGDLANVSESGVLVTYLEPGVTPALAHLQPGTTTPSADAALNERPVAALPQLTLPDGVDAGAELGLDTFEATGYEEALEALRGASGPIAGDGHPVVEPEHWIGGHATGVQGHPPTAGTVLLLHLSWDPPLNFMWADGGAIQFRIDADRLAARRLVAGTQ